MTITIPKKLVKAKGLQNHDVAVFKTSAAGEIYIEFNKGIETV